MTLYFIMRILLQYLLNKNIFDYFDICFQVKHSEEKLDCVT